MENNIESNESKESGGENRGPEGRGAEGTPDGAVGGEPPPQTDPELNAWTLNKLQDIKKAVEMLNLYQGSGPAKTQEEAMKKRFEFWETQPVPKLDEVPDRNEPIEKQKSVEDIRPDPYSLPQGFAWDTLDVDDDPIVCIHCTLFLQFILCLSAAQRIVFTA